MTEQEEQLLHEPYKPCPRCGASPRCSVALTSRSRKGAIMHWMECTACGYTTHRHISDERVSLEWQVGSRE